MNEIKPSQPSTSKTSRSGKRANSTEQKKQAATQHSKVESPLSLLAAKEVQKKIKNKIRNLDLSKAEDNRKARKIVLETCVIWEFGDNIINDPKLPQMLKSIETKIDSNDALKQRYDAFIKNLVKKS